MLITKTLVAGEGGNLQKNPAANGPTLTSCTRAVLENPSEFTIEGRKSARPYNIVPFMKSATKLRRTCGEERDRKTSRNENESMGAAVGRSAMRRLVMKLF